MTDRLPLRAVFVGAIDDGDEYYVVGNDGVTAIEWGEMPGLHCMLPTVCVLKDGQLHSEHPFVYVRSVYYAEAPQP